MANNPCDYTLNKKICDPISPISGDYCSCIHSLWIQLSSCFEKMRLDEPRVRYDIALVLKNCNKQPDVDPDCEKIYKHWKPTLEKYVNQLSFMIPNRDFIIKKWGNCPNKPRAESLPMEDYPEIFSSILSQIDKILKKCCKEGQVIDDGGMLNIANQLDGIGEYHTADLIDQKIFKVFS
jgi:hypothetical protein